MSILHLNPLLIAASIIKLHHDRNLHPCHLVVTDEIAVPNHAEVMQFRHEIVKKLLVKVKNVVYDGREKNSFCLSKHRRSNTIAFHSPSSNFPYLFKKVFVFHSQNLGP